jgi:hypothetical protein
MKVPILSFVTLCYKFLFVKELHNTVHDFYPNENNNNNNLHFSDVKGNVFSILTNETTSQNTNLYLTNAKKIYSDIKYINNFKQNDNKYNILNFHGKNETTVIDTPNNRIFYEWKDTTCYEIIDKNNVYLRMNYFGSVFQHAIDNNHVSYLNLCPFFIRNEFIQMVCYTGDLFFVINNNNILKVFIVENNKTKLIYTYILKGSSIVKKFDIRKYGDFFQLLILYKDDRIDLFTFQYSNCNLFKFYNKNTIVENDVVDIDFISNVVVCMKRKGIVMYYYNPYKSESQVIISQTIPHLPWFSSIVWFQNKVFLNGNSEGIPYIQIDTNLKKMNETVKYYHR